MIACMHNPPGPHTTMIVCMHNPPAALHEILWSAEAEERLPSKVSNGAGLTAAAEPGGDAEEMEALRDEIEMLREKVGDLEYEAQQIRNAAKHHVQEVRSILCQCVCACVHARSYTPRCAAYLLRASARTCSTAHAYSQVHFTEHEFTQAITYTLAHFHTGTHGSVICTCILPSSSRMIMRRSVY